MEKAMPETFAKLIHIATCYTAQERQYLYLRQKGPQEYQWSTMNSQGLEQETSVKAETIEESLRLGAKYWKDDNYQGLRCGYRFTLPERDEHGMNALFHQMSSALQTFNGVYFDEELGHHCIIRQIPLYSREIWQKLRSEKRI